LAGQRYTAGIVSYLEVVDASRGTLLAERAQAQLAGQRLIASVQLIKALGGGWTEDQLLSNKEQLSVQRSAEPRRKD
jgi:outer membrane protein, multidrug efflux system